MTLMDMASFQSAQDAPEEPFVLFKQWFKEAETQEVAEPNAACLATADEYGRPAARTVLVKDFGETGFVFFTNRDSRKGRALAVNPHAAMTFYWKSIARQVHIEGGVVMLDDAESDAYYHTRPRGSRIGAWASQQSHPMEKREMLLGRVQDYEKKYAHDENIPRPPHWGGYRLAPVRIEFWQEGKFRLHHRILYTRMGSNWQRQMLYP